MTQTSGAGSEGTPRRASFTLMSGPQQGSTLEVHFNPESLEHTITNTMEKRGKGNSAKQFVSQSTAKLSMELVFDTTDTGEDVRAYTDLVAKMMEPVEDETPPITKFEWGTYEFQGMVESYKATLDFFSSDGVPLRATVSLTLVAQDRVFADSERGQADTAGSLGPGGDAVEVPQSQNRSLTDTASRAGDPSAAREMAEHNQEESLRFPSSASVEITLDPRLEPPAAFARGGAGIGLEAGLGLDIGASAGFGFGAEFGLGVEMGVGVGFDVGVDLEMDFGLVSGPGGPAGTGASRTGGGAAPVGAGSATRPVTSAAAGGAMPPGASPRRAVDALVGAAGSASTPYGVEQAAGEDTRGLKGAVFGGSASAGVPARAGAFAGLEITRARRSRARRLRPHRLFPDTGDRRQVADESALFEIGGQARQLTPRSLSTDVGQLDSLAARIRFDEE